MGCMQQSEARRGGNGLRGMGRFAPELVPKADFLDRTVTKQLTRGRRMANTLGCFGPAGYVFPLYFTYRKG